ncbi:MAG: aminoglycoside phosphotransferase family protein [Spirochaetales bacterium]|nr:aminoglycoside phosphotransferase family protein [Spirochaetales bacterium]
MEESLKKKRPEITVVKSIAKKHIPHVVRVEAVEKGTSTFVYRIKTENETFYFRFLPEDTTFGAEVLTHNLLLESGVIVPEIIAYEEWNRETGLSMMLLSEIPGNSIEDEMSSEKSQILYEAGKQIGLLHNIPVDGFGWIDRNHLNELKAEKANFLEYYSEFLEYDLKVMENHPYSDLEKSKIREFVTMGMKRLDTTQASLVHGDYDFSHIYHRKGKYTGLIDFGEIRGNNPLFDFATFLGFEQDRESLKYLLEGYREERHFSEENIISSEIFALFMLLRFLGRKNKISKENFWFKRVRMQLKVLLTYSIMDL